MTIMLRLGDLEIIEEMRGIKIRNTFGRMENR